MASDRWVQRWEVPKSSGDGNWTVAIDRDGNYGCSCPVWKFKRQECHHIMQVKNGGGNNHKRPTYVLAKVNKPELNEETNELLIPLVGIPDANMMEATICYYLLKHSYSIGEIRNIRRVPRDWSAKAIMDHVERHGEAEYPAGWYEH